MEFSKYTLNNGTELYLINSDFCATTYMEIDFYSYKDKNEGKKSLVHEVLMEGCSKYPTKQDISIATDREYCTIGSHSYSNGDVHANSFYIDVLTKESLTGRKDTFENSLEILNNVLDLPLVINKAFSQEYFDRAKEELIVSLKRLEMDKETVAEKRFFETILGDSAFAYPNYGSIEEVEKVTNEDVMENYLKMLGYPKKVFVSTNLNKEYVIECIERVLVRTYPCYKEEIRISKPPKKETKISRLEEPSNFEQCMIYIGFPYEVKKSQSDIDAFALLNGYIGGYSGGKLFTEIRTKRHMAYGAYSYVSRSNGIIYGSTGVDIKNKDKAIDIMLKEIMNAASGKITKSGFEKAKLNLLNSYKSRLHVISQRLGAIETAVLMGEEENLKQYEKRLENVSYEDVAKAASLIDTSSPLVYCLLQGGKK